MLKLRTDTTYIKPDGKLNQAGYEALQGQFDDKASASGLAAVEAAVAGSFIRLQTAQTASGNTEFDFTGVPSWANRITIIAAGLSTSGTSNVIVQIGDSGGFETTGYLSTNTVTAGGALASAPITAGFFFSAPQAATDVLSGRCTLSRLSGNLWVHDSTAKRNTSGLTVAAGDKTLSDTLTQVRVTMANGTDTFDAGSVNISWE